MVLTQKESAALKDLCTQEASCVEKYNRFSKAAKDPNLKQLFEELSKEEAKHLKSLEDALRGQLRPLINCNDSRGRKYKPTVCYHCGENSAEKANDCFLVTDCIGTEKLVSGEYNTDVFLFGNSELRKLLADIQIEEQNHAEMLWKYKVANRMTEEGCC